MGTIGWFEADAIGQWKPLDMSARCDALAARVGEGEVLVLVHGVKGDGEEISGLLPILTGSKPGAVLLYRWVAWDERDAIARGFANGISRLLECVPSVDGQLLVVAHSAGGIVVGYGARWISVPVRARTGPAIYMMTVAAPLAGMNDRAPNADGRAEARFMLDFDTRISGYPAAPGSVAMVHLRTQYPGDEVMKPTPLHQRNDPKIGVPGARQIDLPATLTHDGSLVYVARKVADGTWRGWFEEPAK